MNEKGIILLDGVVSNIIKRAMVGTGPLHRAALEVMVQEYIYINYKH